MLSYILPKEPFFHNNKGAQAKVRKEILEYYPPPENFPQQIPEPEPSWQQIMGSGAKAREKKLFNIAQQLMEASFPITHLTDFLHKVVPQSEMGEL